MTPFLCPKYNEKRVADYESRCLRKRDLKNCNNLAVNKDKLAYIKYTRHIQPANMPRPPGYISMFSRSPE